MKGIWNDRIVLPGNVVVMPEEVRTITQWKGSAGPLLGQTGWVCYYIEEPSKEQTSRIDITNARIDRCTFLSDKHGKMIYERDRVLSDNRVGFIAYQGGIFCIKWTGDNGSDALWDFIDDLEVIGMESYKEDADAK